MLVISLAENYCEKTESKFECVPFRMQNQDDPPQPERMSPIINSYYNAAASTASSVSPSPSPEA